MVLVSIRLGIVNLSYLISTGKQIELLTLSYWRKTPRWKRYRKRFLFRVSYAPIHVVVFLEVDLHVQHGTLRLVLGYVVSLESTAWIRGVGTVSRYAADVGGQTQTVLYSI